MQKHQRPKECDIAHGGKQLPHPLLRSSPQAASIQSVIISEFRDTALTLLLQLVQFCSDPRESFMNPQLLLQRVSHSLFLIPVPSIPYTTHLPQQRALPLVTSCIQISILKCFLPKTVSHFAANELFLIVLIQKHDSQNHSWKSDELSTSPELMSELELVQKIFFFCFKSNFLFGNYRYIPYTYLVSKYA